MNAREAMHVIELRRRPGHPAIAASATDAWSSASAIPAIARGDDFADHSVVELERLQAERARGRRAASRPDDGGRPMGKLISLVRAGRGLGAH